jgi:hypothetical protein
MAQVQDSCIVCDGVLERIGYDLEQLEQELVSAIDSGNTDVACKIQQQLTKLQAKHDGMLKKIQRLLAIAADEHDEVRRLGEVRWEIRIAESWLSSGNYEGLDASVIEGMLIERKAELAAIRGQLHICELCYEH